MQQRKRNEETRENNKEKLRNYAKNGDRKKRRGNGTLARVLGDAAILTSTNYTRGQGMRVH